MTRSEPQHTSASPTRATVSSSSSVLPTVGITIYGCGDDEARLFREMAPRLGVVPTITAAPLSERNIGLVFGNRCVSVSHKTPVTNSALRTLSEAGVTYISTRSVGYDHIDVTYADSVGISIGTVTYSPDSVADYTLMLMLMAVRHARSLVRRADVHDYRLPGRGRELHDMTVGVVGTGRIGSAVIDRLRGFGCRTLAYDTRAKTSAEYVGLGELLEQSDVVTFHIPLTSETRHLLGHRELARMKHDAVIVNTARGALVDTEALVSALERGRLGGAALDVLEGEEGIFYADCSDTPVAHQLLLRLHKLPNVLISPHAAYYTDRALYDIVENSLINCVTFGDGTRRG